MKNKIFMPVVKLANGIKGYFIDNFAPITYLKNKGEHTPSVNKDGESPKKTRSIAWQLLIDFLVFAFAMLVLLWIIQTVFFSSFYKAIKTKNIMSCVQSIQDNITNRNLHELIELIGEENDVCIDFYSVDEEFEQRFSVSVNQSCSIHSLTNDELQEYYLKAKANNGTYNYIEDSYESERLTFVTESDGDLGNSFNGESPVFEKEEAQNLITAVVFTSEEDDEYLVLLSAMITPLKSTVATLQYQLRLITAVFIIFSLFLALISAKAVSKPIEEINKTARLFGNGDYDVKFNGRGYKEIEQLSDTLNYAAEELQQIDQMRRDLIANVSHDLRTPLTLITGYGEVMRDLPGENTPENVQVIIDEATRLKNLVNDLIDISKIEAGRMKLEPSVFCITDSIKEMFGRYNKLKEQEGFTFDFEYDCDVYVYADALKISQVIYNLVNNAVNYIGEDKNIIIRQICVDDRVRIEVEDHGPGIPPEKLRNIWDRYYKVDKSHQSARIGSGLGLSIVKSVLRLHKSQFDVFSTVGKGSTFWFELKRTNEDGEPFHLSKDKS